ncbi:hypothetical protein [Nocardia sp. NBC_01327]|uniref:hypothetical protein n=1 Tax=Nocardia sp. NBC_01327 TaxID=2903593 RepID=UPI002E117384|nr:hypothetical protein OG326_23815 [Nocardia sp. NBC_01327]
MSYPYPTGMLVYAQVSDLTTMSATTGIQWMSVAPANAGALIRRASNLVTEATEQDTYYTYPIPAAQTAPSSAPCGTTAGMPVLPYQAQAFVDAVCQQVVEWSTAAVNPDAGLVGQPEVIGQQSVPGGAVTYIAEQTQQWQKDSVECLCSASLRILRLAGLAVNRPYTL